MYRIGKSKNCGGGLTGKLVGKALWLVSSILLLVFSIYKIGSEDGVVNG